MGAQNVKQDEERLSKREFITFMAKRYGIKSKEAARAYEMVMDSIREAVEQGNELCLMGFGRFYLQTHKGHPVRFKDDENDKSTSKPETEVEDYIVFKFSASNALNQHIRERARVRKAEPGAPLSEQ